MTPLVWRFPAALRAGPVRALFEGVLGYSVCLLLALLFNGANHQGQNPASIMAALFGLFWLAAWPAWRMRTVRFRWTPIRIPVGILRALLSGFFLALAALGLAALLWRPALEFLIHGGVFPRGSGSQPIALLFLSVRTVVILIVSLRRYLGVRLRRQLMGSQVAVVVATFVTMTFFGSLIGINLVLQGFRPDAPLMAQSARNLLLVSHSVQPLNRGQAITVMREIESGVLEVRGKPRLAGLTSFRDQPEIIWLVRPNGRVLVAVNREIAAAGASLSWDRLRSRDPYGIETLRQAALHRSAMGIPLQGADITENLQPVIAEAPILNPRGQVNAILVLQVSQPSLSSLRLLQGALALFGATTIVLILATSLPVLAISFLFAYLVARGLTRHLEAVSRVASSIAAGELSARAPVQTRNEIGRLASTVNRMADHLESAMGELHEARTQAVEALKARQVLVASISHELRTPLAIIHAHLEHLLEHRPTPTGRAATLIAERDDIPVPFATLTALQSETERLAGLVDDLFALSRAETDGLHVSREEVDVAALVDEVAALMRPLAQQEGHLALSVQASPGLPHAAADPDRLRQILANLVRNAVRHTPDGGIIVLSVYAEDRWVVIGVADTGEGIPPDHLPHIFEPFYRVDQARSRSSGGAGLGLALVREFVEAMGGQVTVQSTPGEGSCFQVLLPVSVEVAGGPQ